jgi:hypothetical protein
VVCEVLAGFGHWHIPVNLSPKIQHTAGTPVCWVLAGVGAGIYRADHHPKSHIPAPPRYVTFWQVRGPAYTGKSPTQNPTYRPRPGMCLSVRLWQMNPHSPRARRAERISRYGAALKSNGVFSRRQVSLAGLECSKTVSGAPCASSPCRLSHLRCTCRLNPLRCTCWQRHCPRLIEQHRGFALTAAGQSKSHCHSTRLRI